MRVSGKKQPEATMQLQVRARNMVLTEALRVHAERRVQFALSRFGDRIRRVAVQLGDVNGPRGGEDKICRLEVLLSPSGEVRAEESDADLYATIDRAAERAGRSVGRVLTREREFDSAAAKMLRRGVR